MADQKKRPIARAIYKFEGQSDHELSFSPGEAILLLKRVDENWLEGELDGQIGIFPSNRVRIELGSPSLSQESALARSGRPCGVVLHDFPGDMDGDLPLQQGQIVELMGTVSAGWTRGRADGKIGIFPASFIEVLQPLKTSRRPTPRPRSFKNTSVPQPSKRNSLPVITQSDDFICNGEEEIISDQDLNTGEGSLNDIIPDAKPRLSHYASVSTLERHISGIQSSLDAEEKMMKSAKSLLKVCQSEEKKVKLSQTLASHQQNVDNYRRQLIDAEDQRDSVMSLQIKSTPVTPPSPISPIVPLSKEVQRQKVREELYNTERDYHRELSALCSKVLPAFKQWKVVKWRMLFSNIEQVTELSGNITTSLDGIQTEDEGGGNKVGVVFREFASKIKEVYGTYCRNHDNASQLLEKLLEDSSKATEITRFIDKGRPDIQAWDLHTLLIKPVQRIVKYPLLLGKLLEATPIDHPDHKLLISAAHSASQVAQDINEIKRRKDLLERYTGSGRDERRLNFGTLRKKVRRLEQSLTQKTGLRSATIDPKYIDEECKVLALENCVRTLQLNVLAWQDEVEHLFINRDILMETMSLYSTNSNVIVNDANKRLQLMKQKWREQNQEIRECVLDPLGILLELFHDPLLLMHKRGDKLLDYDSLQHNLEKASEPEKIEVLREQVTLAKRTYEALNTQLLEELPIFCSHVAQATTRLLKTYLHQQLSFHEAMTSLLEMDSTLISTSFIFSTHTEALQTISHKLSKLSIVPAALAVSFGVRQQNTPESSSPRKMTKSLSTHTSPSSSPSNIKNRRLSLDASPTLSSQLQQNVIYEELQYQKELLSKPHEYDHVPVDEDKEDEEQEMEVPVPIDSKPNTYDTVPLEPVSVSESLDRILLTPPTSHPSTPVNLDNEEESERTDVASPSEGMTLFVMYDFISENPSELSVREGDYVTLISMGDDGGSGEWWLVETQTEGDTEKGYIPYNYLSFDDPNDPSIET